jgi:hypothetical protein
MGKYELNDRVNEAKAEFDGVKDQIASLREHTTKALGITDAIRKGVFS